MKSNGIHSVLTYSEKRKNILFLLQERPRTITEINDYLKIKSTESSPRLKELETVDLVTRNGDCYELTWVGKVVAVNYAPFLDTITSIERNKDFWINHDLSVIPKKFQNNLKFLKNCKVVRSKDYKICYSHDEFVDNVINAEHIKGVTSVFNPYWITLFTEVSTTDISIDLIITKEIYNEIKRDYSKELKFLLENPNAHIYIYNDELKIAFATMDVFDGTFFSLGLYDINTGQYDNQNDMEGTDQSSFMFGEFLFEYFKDKAMEVPRGQPTSELVMYNQELETV